MALHLGTKAAASAVSHFVPSVDMGVSPRR